MVAEALEDSEVCETAYSSLEKLFFDIPAPLRHFQGREGLRMLCPAFRDQATVRLALSVPRRAIRLRVPQIKGGKASRMFARIGHRRHDPFAPK